MNPEQRQQAVSLIYPVISDSMDAGRGAYQTAIDVVMTFEDHYASEPRTIQPDPGPASAAAVVDPPTTEQEARDPVIINQPPRRKGSK
jgi:hypothetical protein